jgi:hypothetical protein
MMNECVCSTDAMTWTGENQRKTRASATLPPPQSPREGSIQIMENKTKPIISIFQVFIVGKVQISVFWVERILEESVVSSIRVNTW